MKCKQPGLPDEECPGEPKPCRRCPGGVQGLPQTLAPGDLSSSCPACWPGGEGELLFCTAAEHLWDGMPVALQ